MSNTPYTLHVGDSLAVLATLPENSIDSVVTDPPYELGFMGKGWDKSGIANNPALWAQVLRVLKPGGHLLAFSGTRTQHRMVCAIEDAGFEVRDQIGWAYGSGFPKSLDVSKAVDKLDATHVRRMRQLSFTEWIRGTGLTSSRIDEVTGTNMGGHYTTSASQPAVATREHFEKLRPLIPGPVPQWIEDMVNERTVESENFKRREVVGKSENGIAGGTGEHAGESGAYGFAAEYNVTRAYSDQAKQWAGWGTALKPAWEPVCVARKPLVGTVAANVLQFGTGALNIDGCRVPGGETGRWPANIVHDGSDEVLAAFPDAKGQQGVVGPQHGPKVSVNCYGDYGARETFEPRVELSKSAARFFYCAKASGTDRDEGCENLPVTTAADMVDRDAGSAGMDSPRAGAGRTSGRRNNHPTVKPTALMRYLVRLVTPPGGTVLDPFLGSGSTGKAAMLEGFKFVGVDLSPEYVAIAQARIEWAVTQRNPVEVAA